MGEGFEGGDRPGHYSYSGLPNDTLAYTLTSPNVDWPYRAQSHTDNHHDPDPSTPKASPPSSTPTIRTTGISTKATEQTSYPTPSSEIRYHTNDKVEGVQRASAVLNHQILQSSAVPGLQNYPLLGPRIIPMPFSPREHSQTSRLPGNTNGCEDSAPGSPAAPGRHRRLSPVREQPDPPLVAFPLANFPTRPAYGDFPAEGDRRYHPGAYRNPDPTPGSNLMASGPMLLNGGNNAHAPYRPASGRLRWAQPERYDPPRDQPGGPGDRWDQRPPIITSVNIPHLPWALDDGGFEGRGSCLAGLPDHTCRPHCIHTRENPRQGLARGIVCNGNGNRNGGHGNGNGNGHEFTPMRHIEARPWPPTTTTTTTPISRTISPATASSHGPTPFLHPSVMDRDGRAVTPIGNGNGNGNGNGIGNGIGIGISQNYGGDPLNPANQSANIRDEENTSLWLTNLPPDCDHRMLLTAIRDCGKVYASVVNPPTVNNNFNNPPPHYHQNHNQNHNHNHNHNHNGNENGNGNGNGNHDRFYNLHNPAPPNRNPYAMNNFPVVNLNNNNNQLLQQHMTSAAKVVFFERHGASQLLSQAHRGRFRVGGFVPRVRSNRIRSAAREPGPQCRVLHIEGPAEIVNYRFLRAFFSSKFTFELEDVFLVVGNNLSVLPQAQAQAPLLPVVAPPLPPPPPSSQLAAAFQGQQEYESQRYQLGPQQQQQPNLVLFGARSSTTPYHSAKSHLPLSSSPSPPPSPSPSQLPQQQQQEQEQEQQQQRVRLEWRFGSYRCQAESARQSIHREKDRVDLPAHMKALWSQVNVHYGVDPCGP